MTKMAKRKWRGRIQTKVGGLGEREDEEEKVK